MFAQLLLLVALVIAVLAGVSEAFYGWGGFGYPYSYGYGWPYYGGLYGGFGGWYGR
ncbi:hypothetical protein I4U23_006295 [Adineta vaga]|nr:hypothetical protein I4U23_006295 [Adineta vaga]